MVRDEAIAREKDTNIICAQSEDALDFVRRYTPPGSTARVLGEMFANRGEEEELEVHPQLQMALDSPTTPAQYIYQVGTWARFGGAPDENTIPHDHRLAVKCFLVAAERGSVDSMFMLAVMYQYALGTPRDLRAARHWYTQANIVSGHDFASHMLDSLPPESDLM